jgi:site-specific DNA-methyltransferase (adenine-specific)
MVVRRSPGVVRDAIMNYLRDQTADASLGEIHQAVCEELGEDVPTSSIRSYLRLNTPDTFTRTGRGRYKLRVE